MRLDVGGHALGVHAFVCRKPDENHERVYEWLLQRNLRLYAVSFAVDRLGDIYLDARLPLGVLDAEDSAELDRLLGAVLTASDESFNTILELGFSSAIRKEWDWRRSRGEPTHNLEAFRGWLEDDEGSLVTQLLARTSTKATAAGSAWTTRIRRLTVAAPYSPATTTHPRKNSVTSVLSATRPQISPAARKPL